MGSGIFLVAVGAYPTVSARGADAARLTQDGYGAIQIGMDEKEAEMASGLTLRKDTGDFGDCGYLFTRTGPRIDFLTTLGKIAYAYTRSRRVPTVAGLRVGDSRRAIFRRLGRKRVRKIRSIYPPTRLLEYKPPEGGDRRIRFSTLKRRSSRRERISGITGGRLPEIRYVEGCL